MKNIVRSGMALVVMLLGGSLGLNAATITLVNSSSHPIYVSYTTICELGVGVIGGLTKVTRGDTTDPIPLYPGKVHEINHANCRIVGVKLFKGCLSSVKNGERLDGVGGKVIIHGETVKGNVDKYDEVPDTTASDSSLPGALAEMSPYFAKARYYIHDRP